MSQLSEDRLKNIESDMGEMKALTNEMHNALMGDRYGNNGYIHRICRLEKAVKSIDRRVWMTIGGLSVATFVINIIFAI